MPRIRFLIGAALALVMCLALAGSAVASPTVIRNSGWVPVAPPGAANSDCAMIAQLVNDPATGIVFGRGSASCTGRKQQVAVTQTIKATSTNGTVYTYKSLFTPLVTPLWVFSPNFQNGCFKWQTITNVQINDGSHPITTAYVTTSTPVKFVDHCPY